MGQTRGQGSGNCLNKHLHLHTLQRRSCTVATYAYGANQQWPGRGPQQLHVLRCPYCLRPLAPQWTAEGVG